MKKGKSKTRLEKAQSKKPTFDVQGSDCSFQGNDFFLVQPILIEDDDHVIGFGFICS